LEKPLEAMAIAIDLLHEDVHRLGRIVRGAWRVLGEGPAAPALERVTIRDDLGELVVE
jgi:hypothetical protein